MAIGICVTPTPEISTLKSACAGIAHAKNKKIIPRGDKNEVIAFLGSNNTK
jgi:hypothetical protein